MQTNNKKKGTKQEWQCCNEKPEIDQWQQKIQQKWVVQNMKIEDQKNRFQAKPQMCENKNGQLITENTKVAYS